MPGAKWIIFAFRTLRETCKTTALSLRAHAITAFGQYFMRIGLMPHVPDQSVIRSIKNLVQGNCQLHNAEPGSQMPPGGRDNIHHLGAQFACQLRQLSIIDLAQFVRACAPDPKGVFLGACKISSSSCHKSKKGFPEYKSLLPHLPSSLSSHDEKYCAIFA